MKSCEIKNLLNALLINPLKPLSLKNKSKVVQ